MEKIYTKKDLQDFAIACIERYATAMSTDINMKSVRQLVEYHSKRLEIETWKDTIYYTDFTYGQIFWKGNSIIAALHIDEGRYKAEYMSVLFKSCNIEMVYVHIENWPEFINETTAIQYGIETE